MSPSKLSTVVVKTGGLEVEHIQQRNPVQEIGPSLILIYFSGDLIDVVDLEVATGHHCQLSLAAKLEDLGAPWSYI